MYLIKQLLAALQERISRTAVTRRQAVDMTRAYQRGARVDPITGVIELYRHMVDTVALDHPDRPLRLLNLSLALQRRFEQSGQLADLDQAIVALTDVVDTVPLGGPDRPTCLSNLGFVLQRRFEHSGQLADLEKAVAAAREAVDTTPPDQPDRPACLSNLSVVLQRQFEHNGQLGDLEKAVAAAREAVDTTPPDHPGRPTCLSNLSLRLRDRFERTGQLADLEKAVAAAQEAVETTPPDHPDRSLCLAVLGLALRARFDHSDQLTDLDQAIISFTDAVVPIPPDHHERPGFLSNLGIALRARFERTGQLGDLDKAVSIAREAVNTTPRNHTKYPVHLANLGVALCARFDHRGQLADLDQAITAYEDVLAAIPPEHPNRPGLLSNLGIALCSRFERTGQLEDLEEAVAAAHDAADTTPFDHPKRPRWLSNFSGVLQTRFHHSGQLGDLEEAVAAARDAVDTTPPDHPDRSLCLAILGSALSARFKRTGQLGDLDEALATARDAVDTISSDHPDRADRLSNLGTMLRVRFEHSGQLADLDQAITALKDAVAVESGSPDVRLRAGVAWGEAAMEAGSVESAADGFAAAVRLLPFVAWHGLPQVTREQHLVGWSGLASAAAACAIRASRPEQAVELLEAGRSVLWTQTLNLRSDLMDLAQRAPQLATRLDQVRTRLDTPLTAAATEIPLIRSGANIDQLRTAEHHAVEDRMRLAREFDDLVNQVRSLAGFEHFLAPVPFARLRNVDGSGPVIIVNTSPYGSHALVVTSGAHIVDLPNLAQDQAIDRVNNLLQILIRSDYPDRPFLDRERDRHTVLDILDWLWDSVTDPILASLGHTSPPQPDEVWPRVWWCPTGPLALLPLHAAGHHPRHQRCDTTALTDTVPDRVISSYTPTLTALLRARTAPAPDGRPTLLAVGMPTTPGQAELPAVPAELDRIHVRYPITTRLESPSSDDLRHRRPPDPGTQPTIAKVLAELPRHSWVHLACHGSQTVTNPAESGFWLTDGPLRIIDLAEQHDLGPCELAFLSACQTATGSPWALDEAIHLAAAMQLLSYRHVIAALWSVHDSRAPDLAEAIYTMLTITGEPDANHAAHALHHAVSALRTEHPTDPFAWALYLHTGP